MAKFNVLEELALWMHKRKPEQPTISLSPVLQEMVLPERGDYTITWSLVRIKYNVSVLRYSYQQRDSSIASFAMKAEDPRTRWTILFHAGQVVFTSGDIELVDHDYQIQALTNDQPTNVMERR